MAKQRQKMTWILVGIVVLAAILLAIINYTPKVETPVNFENATVLAVPTEEQAREMQPAAYNFEEAKAKGLIKKDIYETSYRELQTAYKTAMDCYICMNTDLEKYQSTLSESELGFAAGEDIYRLTGSFGRENICIRNTIFVENLSKEDIAVFQRNMVQGRVFITAEVLEVVERTMPDVIVVGLNGDNTPKDVVFDNGDYGSVTVQNGNLVIEISYSTGFDSHGDLMDSAEAEAKRAEVVNDLKTQMEKELSDKLGIGVTVIVIH